MSQTYEHPNWTAPADMPSTLHMADQSWHNDTCPSWSMPLGTEFSLRLWVEYPEGEREMEDSMLYLAELTTALDDPLDIIAQADTWAECLRQIRESGKVPENIISRAWGESE
jgi:hypothetical protein